MEAEILSLRFYMVRLDSRAAIGKMTRLLIKRIATSIAIASNPRPRYMTRLSASLPYVQGSILVNARPPDARSSGDSKAPVSMNSGKDIAISSIVSVDELRILEESNKPQDKVKIAIRDVTK